MRQCVEADITNLRCILEKTSLSKTDLEAQICLLEEELAFLKKTHQEVCFETSPMTLIQKP